MDRQNRKMTHFERALANFKAGKPYVDDLRESNRCVLEVYRASSGRG